MKIESWSTLWNIPKHIGICRVICPDFAQLDPVSSPTHTPFPIWPSETIQPDTQPNQTQWGHLSRHPSQYDPVRLSSQITCTIWPSDIIYLTPSPIWPCEIGFTHTLANMTQWDYLPRHLAQYDAVRSSIQTPCLIWPSEVIYPDTLHNVTQWESSTQTPCTIWPSEVIYPDTLHNVTQWGHLPRHPAQCDPVRSSTQTPWTIWPSEVIYPDTLHNVTHRAIHPIGLFIRPTTKVFRVLSVCLRVKSCTTID